MHALKCYTVKRVISTSTRYLRSWFGIGLSLTNRFIDTVMKSWKYQGLYTGTGWRLSRFGARVSTLMFACLVRVLMRCQLYKSIKVFQFLRAVFVIIINIIQVNVLQIHPSYWSLHIICFSWNATFYRNWSTRFPSRQIFVMSNINIYSLLGQSRCRYSRTLWGRSRRILRNNTKNIL